MSVFEDIIYSDIKYIGLESVTEMAPLIQESPAQMFSLTLDPYPIRRRRYHQ